MKKWATSVLGVVFMSAAVVTHAQWLNYKTPGVPRTAEGKPKLDAPAPRSADGHVDLSGVWMHNLTPVEELRRLYGGLIDEEIKNQLPGMEATNAHKYALNILSDFTGASSPARPEAVQALKERSANPNPQQDCYTSSVPVFLFPIPGLLSEPIKIIQAPRVTMVLYEVGGNFRQVYTDGRRLPSEVNLPAYLGYSVGRWERDTFIVETAGFNDKTLLDIFGNAHSDQLRIVERFRRLDFGRLDVEMTYEDAKMYTRPFTISIAYHLLADQDIFEMFDENEKDCAHIAKAKAK